MDTEHTRLNLLLNHEIVNVVTAIRQTARSSMKQDDVRGEPSRYDEALRLLRADIFKQKSWRDVDPMLYLKPLLLLIKTPDISGPVTGAAAVALQHILRSDLITLQTVNAEASINQVVEDATQCRFESTYNPDDNRQHHSKDELVLLNIIQVLTTAVECQAGILINDEVLCKAFQASFMLGDPVTKPKEYGEIIGVYSRQACGRMVRLLFGRLANVSANSEAAAMSPDQLRSQCCHGVKAAADVLDFLVGLLAVKDSNGLAASVQSHEGSEAALLFAFEMVHLGVLPHPATTV
ncbi:SEC7 domain-containing protein [Haematococcus lacustris]|uniref:SEC7 domain-containing protein n=1 Tax=Haematococcus lacustris TaxID=44745 RepID=A0A699YIQ6_HAELA|nr:SEC7 domain-containing protein [Haematococcus lacustris]